MTHNRIIITTDVPRDCDRVSPARAPSRTGHREVLPCLTLTFETIDKTRPQEFSREVRHAPSTNDKPERRAVSKEEARYYDEIIRGQIDVVKRAVPFFSSHREYAEKSMPLSRTYARNLIVPYERLT